MSASGEMTCSRRCARGSARARERPWPRSRACPASTRFRRVQDRGLHRGADADDREPELRALRSAIARGGGVGLHDTARTCRGTSRRGRSPAPRPRRGAPAAAAPGRPRAPNRPRPMTRTSSSYKRFLRHAVLRVGAGRPRPPPAPRTSRASLPVACPACPHRLRVVWDPSFTRIQLRSGSSHGPGAARPDGAAVRRLRALRPRGRRGLHPAVPDDDSARRCTTPTTSPPSGRPRSTRRTPT